jgi:hypothetical protein
LVYTSKQQNFRQLFDHAERKTNTGTESDLAALFRCFAAKRVLGQGISGTPKQAVRLPAAVMWLRSKALWHFASGN